MDQILSTTGGITPPPELVQQWIGDYYGCPVSGELAGVETAIATRAAQWGADQELEACCEEMKSIPSPLGIPFGKMASNALHAARRPKPPSLKQVALLAIDVAVADDRLSADVADVVRRALEQLPDNE